MFLNDFCFFAFHWLYQVKGQKSKACHLDGEPTLEPTLKLKPINPLFLQKFSFAYTEMLSPRRKSSVPSLELHRGLAIESASPRQLVESKGMVL